MDKSFHSVFPLIHSKLGEIGLELVIDYLYVPLRVHLFPNGTLEWVTREGWVQEKYQCFFPLVLRPHEDWKVCRGGTYWYFVNMSRHRCYYWYVGHWDILSCPEIENGKEILSLCTMPWPNENTLMVVTDGNQIWQFHPKNPEQWTAMSVVVSAPMHASSVMGIFQHGGVLYIIVRHAFRARGFRSTLWLWYLESQSNTWKTHSHIDLPLRDWKLEAVDEVQGELYLYCWEGRVRTQYVKWSLYHPKRVWRLPELGFDLLDVANRVCLTVSPFDGFSLGLLLY